MFALLSLVLLYSCNKTNYSVCIPTVHPDSIKTEMIPLAIGNYWIYEDNLITAGKRDTINSKVISLESVFVKMNDKVTPSLAYKLKFYVNKGKKLSVIYYYIKCKTKVLLCSAEQTNPYIITKYLNEIFESPEINQVGVLNNKEKWIGTEVIQSKFGALNCYVLEDNKDDNIFRNLSNNSITKSKSYFCKGIGLVRVDKLNKNGALITQRNLINYEIQK